jgi:nitroreductase
MKEGGAMKKSSGIWSLKFAVVTAIVFTTFGWGSSGEARRLDPAVSVGVSLLGQGAAGQTAPSGGAAYTKDQEYLFDLITSRRTVRNFKDTPVPEEHLLKILDMARLAPTSGNQQPWKFLVVRDRAKLDRLKKEAAGWYLDAAESHKDMTPEERKALGDRMAATMERVLSAPVYVAMLTDSQSPYPADNRHDGPLAVALLMITARALGYGTGYYTTFFPETRMREFLGIPARYNLLCFTPIGVPVEWPPSPPKKPLSEFVVFEKF